MPCSHTDLEASVPWGLSFLFLFFLSLPPSCLVFFPTPSPSPLLLLILVLFLLLFLLLVF